VINVTNTQPAGTVIGQDPSGGSKADKGTSVSLTVSSGPGNTTVPGVAGLPLKQAEQEITGANLKIGRVVKGSSTQFAKGQVIDTDPPAGSTPLVGTSINIFVSSGKPLVTVPDVTGTPKAGAKATLESAGFKVSISTQTSTTTTPGDVISQSPLGNAQAPVGSTVSIVVAKAPTTATVPNVKGQTASQAMTALTNAGFKVTEVTQPVHRQINNGKVIAQSPAGGTTAKKGSTVTITVGQYTASSSTTTTTSSGTLTTSTTTST
jgi:serine/threonine-protein kinase